MTSFSYEIDYFSAFFKVLDYVDVIQIGARNMQNFELLKAAGAVNKPILLKRGIRTYETATRNTLDISAVPI